jgi:hypothetical protein
VPDVIDIDPALRALDALADDFAAPGPAAAACAPTWPLLAVPSDQLSPLDLDARDHHLARCARCRVAFVEDALDPRERDAPARAARPEALPVATALPALPAPRRRGTAIAIGVGGLVAAAAAAAVIAVSHHGATPVPAVHPAPVATAAPKASPPIDLVVVADRGALAPPALDPFRDALRTIGVSLPPGSRLTVTVAAADELHVIGRSVAGGGAPVPDLPAAPPLDDGPAFPAAHYAKALDAANGLFDPALHLRGVLAIGELCGTADRAFTDTLDRLRARGVVVRGMAFRVPAVPCGELPVSGLVTFATSQIAPLTVRAADQLLDDLRAIDVIPVTTGPGPAGAPLDLLVLVERGALDHDAYAALRDVLRMAPEHLPVGSLVSVALISGSDVDLIVRDAPVGEPDRYLFAAPDPAGAVPPDYPAVLARARALFADDGRHRAILPFGRICGTLETPAMHAAADGLVRDHVSLIGIALHQPKAGCEDLWVLRHFTTYDLRGLPMIGPQALDALVKDHTGDAGDFHPTPPAPHDR